MIFLAIHTVAATRTAPQSLATLVIEAPTWMEAKNYALRHFAPTEWRNHEDPKSGANGVGLIVTETGEDARADVELRRIGEDRRLELRKKLKKGWGEWKAA